MTTAPSNNLAVGQTDQIGGRKEDTLNSGLSGGTMDQNKQVWGIQPNVSNPSHQEGNFYLKFAQASDQAPSFDKPAVLEQKPDQEQERRALGSLEPPQRVLFDFDKLVDGVQELVGLMQVNSRKLALIKQTPSRGPIASGHTARGLSQTKPADLQNNMANPSAQYTRGRSIGRAEYAHMGANRFGSRGSGKSQDILSHRFGGIPGYAAGLHTISALAGYQANSNNQVQLGSGHSGYNNYNPTTNHQISSLSSNRYPPSGALGFNNSNLGLNSFPASSLSTQNSKQVGHQLDSLSNPNSGLGIISHPSQKSPARFNHVDGGYSPSSQTAAAIGSLALNSSKAHHDNKGFQAYSNNPGSGIRYGGANQAPNLQRSNHQTDVDVDLAKKHSSSSPVRHLDQQSNLLLNQIY